jgi:hypothetical protein
MRIFQIMLKEPCMAEANPACAQPFKEKVTTLSLKIPTATKEKHNYYSRRGTCSSLLGFLFNGKRISITL